MLYQNDLVNFFGFFCENPKRGLIPLVYIGFVA